MTGFPFEKERCLVNGHSLAKRPVGRHSSQMRNQHHMNDWRMWRLTSLRGLKLQLPCRPLLDWMEVKLRRGTGLTRVISASLKVQGRPRYSPQLPGSVVLQAGQAVLDVRSRLVMMGGLAAPCRPAVMRQADVNSQPISPGVLQVQHHLSNVGDGGVAPVDDEGEGVAKVGAADAPPGGVGCKGG